MSSRKRASSFAGASFFCLAFAAAAPSAVGQCFANVSTYCTPGTSAGGCVATISGFGIPSNNAPSGFDIVVAGAPGLRNGSLIYGLAPQATPFAANSSSYRCVSTPFQRLGLINSGGSVGQCNGSLGLDFNTWLATHPNGLGSPYSPGQALYVQGWYRDPSAPGAGNLSNALSFSLCSGSGAPPMFVTSCSLGCSSGSGGAQVSCSQVQGFLNQEFVIEFSEPVASQSVTSSSFQLVDVATGVPAAGTLTVDAVDPRRVTFRPSLSFDAQGLPHFGLASNAAYQLLLPGAAQGDAGPFVTSLQGEPNASRVSCTYLADQGIQDYSPGAPTVSVYAMVAGSPNPVEISGGGVTGVLTQSALTFVYDDVMNLATLLLPATGQSPFVSIGLDVDGNLQTSGDRIPIAGAYSAVVDVANATTTVQFTPQAGWPGPGVGSLPRQVVISLPSIVQDLVGNSLDNPGLRSFVAQ